MKELIINKIRIRNRKNSEIEKFAQFGKMSHEFLHDILNPISSLLLQLEILKENYVKSNNIESDISEINKINENIRKIIRLFQENLIRKEADEVITVNQEIKEVISLNYYKAKRNSISVVIIEKDTVELKLSKIKFYQLIINLFSNSIDSFENIRDNRKRKISIRISKKKNDAEIFFADNGCGIPSNIIKNIFKDKISSKENGFGIGLKTSKRIIEELNGSIKVESEINNGTSFKIKIPIKNFA